MKFRIPIAASGSIVVDAKDEDEAIAKFQTCDSEPLWDLLRNEGIYCDDVERVDDDQPCTPLTYQSSGIVDTKEANE